MMKSQRKKIVFVQVLLVLAIVAIIAFIAWRVIDVSLEINAVQTGVPLNTGATEAANTVPAATNAGDLMRLEDQLNNTQVDDASISELDMQTTF